MATINPYLTFNGTCEDAFNFYKSVFGGEFTYIGHFGDMPRQEGGEPLPEAEAKKVMHVSLPISTETILMGSDCGGEWTADFKAGNNVTISITAATKDEADKIFTSLSDGGQVTMPLADQFWGDYFGMLTDKFGMLWMMSCKSGEMK